MAFMHTPVTHGSGVMVVTALWEIGKLIARRQTTTTGPKPPGPSGAPPGLVTDS
jgi:hypothetical protein